MKTKTKILFVIPDFKLGGTTSALTSLLNGEFAGNYGIDVFAINRQDCGMQTIISHDIGLNELTTAYYGDFSRFNTKDKLKFFFVKLLKQNKKSFKKLENWITRKTIKKIERHRQYDAVVGFQEGLATRFASQFSCAHKIAWIHCDYANAFGKEVEELDLYDCFEDVVCVSQFTRKGFVERYPSLAGKTVAIHNIFDVQSVVKLSKSTVDDPRFDTSQFTIISLGRVHDVKRFYLIPEIAAQLKKEGFDFRWYILGNADIPYELQRLTDAIQRNGIEEHVIYLGGKSNPYPYLKAANLMVTVSKSEACPMIFNEAKILNVPILSADFGSASEFIEQGKDGYISPIEELPRKLIELANHPDILESVKNPISFIEINDESIRLLTQLFNKNN